MGIQSTTPSALSSARNFSTKCILWQYDELMRNPLEGVNAAPKEENVYEWHGNFYFPDDHDTYPCMVVHFTLNLSFDFPNSTPDIQLLTSFGHSHVFGSDICFSLLKAFEYHFYGLPTTAYWNPSRSIRSLLEAVYVFLTVDEDRHGKVDKRTIQWAQRASRTQRCPGCSHCPGQGRIWPPEEDWMAARGTGTVEEEEVCAAAMYEDLSGPTPKPKPVPSKPKEAKKPLVLPAKAVTVEIGRSTTTRMLVPVNESSSSNDLEFSNRAALLKASANEWRTLSDAEQKPKSTIDTEDFKCSISGVAFHHTENVVLGFGVNVERRDRDGSIVAITTDLCPISLAVYATGKIRKSALGSPITHFFPLAINETHWKRASTVLPRCVNEIIGNHPIDSDRLTSQNEKLLFVVGEIWKGLAVLMMKGEAHASEKVLKGFCALHHILLMANDEPDPLSDEFNGANRIFNVTLNATDGVGETKDRGESEGKDDHDTWATVVRRRLVPLQHQAQKTSLRDLAHRKVRDFVRYPDKRHKSQCPDFGRFLPLILFSDVNWAEMQGPVMEELLTRNARWIVKSDRRLASVGPSEAISLSKRVTRSWQASSTGVKLTAFQIVFANRVASWARAALPAHIADAYKRIWFPSVIQHQQLEQRRNMYMIRAMYNRLGGRPSNKMLASFQTETKRIESMGSFQQVFEALNIATVDEFGIQQMLCKAMKNSAKFRYHY